MEWFLKFGTKKPKELPIFNLQLDLTYKCNLQCRHCYQWNFSEVKNDLTFETWQKIIRQYKKLVSQLGTRSAITLSGGEPLMSPVFEKIVVYIRNLDENIELYILTNGTLISNSIAFFIKNNGVRHVQISLDGPNHVLV